MESVGHVGYKHDLCVILLSSVNIIGFVKLELQKKNLSEMHVIDIMILLTSHFWNNVFYLNSVTYKKTTFISFLLI
jgi:hypothetical protein